MCRNPYASISFSEKPQHLELRFLNALNLPRVLCFPALAQALHEPSSDSYQPLESSQILQQS